MQESETVIWKWVAAVVSLIFIVTTEAYYREPLFNKTLTFIPQVQAGASDSQINGWHFWSNFGLTIAEFIPIGLCYIWTEQRVRCVYYAAAFIFITLLTNVMKLGYHNPRPFWVSTEIQAFSCSAQYGNPSGHSSTSMGMAITIWLDLVHTETNLFLKLFMGIVALTFGGSIAYSRLFLGVHSIDQVIFGCCLGFWCAYVLQFCIREHLDIEIGNLISNKVENFKTRFWICWVVYAVVMVGQIVEYAVLNNSIVNDPQWSVNIILAGCSKNLENPYQSLSLVQASMAALGPGIYFGVLFQSYKFKGMTCNIPPPIPPKVKPLLKALARGLVGVGLVIPLGLLALLSTKQISNIYVLMLVAGLIPATQAGFLMFGCADKVSALLGLYDEPLSTESQQQNLSIDAEEEEGMLNSSPVQ